MSHTKQPNLNPLQFPLVRGKVKIQPPKSKNYFAFTLVELIVVIVILAILATIAFLSFNSYSSSSRDSVRLSDINSLNKSLELFNISSAKYPDPTNVYMTVVYSGGAIFEQGKLGDSVITAVQKMSKKPVDPLKNTEYTYSVNMSNTAFQLKANLESKPSTGYNNIPHLTSPNTGEELISSIFPLNKGDMRGIDGVNGDYVILNSIQNLLNNDYTNFQKTNADTNSGSTVCYIKGNFNGLIEKTNTGNTNYILAVPGLVLTDSGSQAGNINIEYSTLSGKVICNGLNDPCVINYTPNVVFVGSGNTLPSTIGDVGAVVGGLKTAYSGSNVSNTNSTISNILTSTGTNMLSLGATVVGKVGATSVTSLSTNTTYPGCNTSDIILDNGQVWAACNVGASVAFTGVNPPDICPSGCPADPYISLRNTIGNYYQWGRNKDVTSVGTTPGPLPIDNTNSFIKGLGITDDWISTQNNNLWGGIGTSYNNGIYNSLGKPVQMKGPCTEGYHIPTNMEWCNAFKNIKSDINCTILTPQTIGNISLKLLLPLTGSRRYDTGDYWGSGGPGPYGYYWSSTAPGSIASKRAFYVAFTNSTIYPLPDGPRTNGLAVRCIKN